MIKKKKKVSVQLRAHTPLFLRDFTTKLVTSWQPDVAHLSPHDRLRSIKYLSCTFSLMNGH